MAALTLAEMRAAQALLRTSSHVIETPLLRARPLEAANGSSTQ